MRKALVLLPLFFPPVPAAEAADIGISVVTPARTARAVADVPGAVEVLTGGQLDAVPGATLNDKLATLVAGADSSRANGIYSYTSAVSLRGVPSSEQGRTLILLDGVPVNTGATGSVNWNRLGEEEIDRVEVFKGPVSSMYGSNAAAGVINVITKRAAPGLRHSISYGTYDTFRGSLGAGATAGKLTLSAYGALLRSGGYISVPENLRDAYTVKKYVRESAVSAKGSLDLGASGVLDAQYSRYQGRRGEGSRIRTADGVSRDYTTDFTRASWQGDNGRTAWQTQAFYQLERYSRLNEYFKGATYTRVDTAALRQDTGAQAAAARKFAGFTATLGADLKLGSVDAVDHNLAPAVYDSKDRGRLAQYAPYAQAEKKLFSDRLKLLAALRYDNAHYFDGYFFNQSAGWGAANGPQKDRYWDKFSPKAAVSWKYSDAAEQYASYGRGFRPPALEDMCLSLLKGSGSSKKFTAANPDLKPETLDTAESGLRLAPLPGLYLDPAAYYTIGGNFIYSASVPGATILINGSNVPVYKAQNLARVRIYGAELPVKFYRDGFSAAAAYAWSKSEILKYPANRALEGRTLAYAPRRTLSVSLGLKTAPADLGLGWTYKSKQYTSDDNSTAVGWYQTFSASASRTFEPGFTLRLSAENLLDERYQESSSDLAPGRTFTAELERKFW